MVNDLFDIISVGYIGRGLHERRSNLGMFIYKQLLKSMFSGKICHPCTRREGLFIPNKTLEKNKILQLLFREKIVF